MNNGVAPPVATGTLGYAMTVITESRITSVVRAAEALLSHRAGSSVVLDDPPEDLGGSGRTTVVRVRVAQNPPSAWTVRW